MKPVCLRDVTVSLEPGQIIELRGKVPSDAKILRRSECDLPKGLRVLRTDVEDGVGKITVQNASKCSMKITPDIVLAEMNTATETLGALVGPSCDAEILIEGVKTSCLLDSGSQVTVISSSFFRKNLKHIPLQELPSETNVIGAGGQTVPFIGMISVQCTLPASIAGIKKTVTVSALVQEDNRFSNKVPVTVGTNVFKQLKEFKLPDNILKGEATFMFATTLDMTDNGKCGHVRLKGKSVVVPAKGSVQVKGKGMVKRLHTQNVVMIQEPTEKLFPEGVGVVAAKVGVGDLHSVDVILYNFGDSDVVIKKNQIVADVFLVHVSYDVEKFVSDFYDNAHQVSEDKTDPEQKAATIKETDKQSEDEQSEKQSKVTFRFGETTPQEWQQHFTRRLNQFQEVFIQNDFDLGRTSEVLHDVELQPGPFVRERPRPIPPADFEEAKKHIQELLDAKIISPSSSPYASPIVLVRKKNGKLRMCVDYRKINARTVKDSYAIPKIEDLLQTLSGAKFFTTMDLSKAYYQVPMTERAKEISAFGTPFGLFQFERMSMGMKNSPHTFQRLIEKVFVDMNLTELIVFLDDILVHAQTLEELEERTLHALQRLREYNLKLDPEKCVFGASRVKHLGYIISDKGIEPDPAKLEALTSWPVPKTVKDVKSFIGFAGYYRRFIPHFAQMAKPLNELTVGYVPGKKGVRKRSSSELSLQSDIRHLWGDLQQAAFQQLIAALTKEPIIAIAKLGKPFWLHCDASGSGLGAVLYQEFDGVKRVIAYASRSLTKTERNYPAHKREFLALKWSLSEKFHDYVLGSHVTVITDNNPLCYNVTF